MIPGWMLSGSRRLRERYTASESRSFHLTGATGALSILLGLGKILSGALSLSVFACVNGLYTLGMAAARYCALAGAVRAKSLREQYCYYRLSGLVMIAASLAYVAYSFWSIWHPKAVYYGKILAITIAFITFTEIGLNLWGVLKFRRSRSPLLHALKTISLGTSLISLVLTQAAILAFTNEVQNPSVNGFLGVLMGFAAMLLGGFMVWRIGRIQTADIQNETEDTEQ